MHHNKNEYNETIDEELYEDISEEEMEQLLLAAKQEKYKEEIDEEPTRKKTQRFSKWIGGLLVIALLLNTFSFIFQHFSIPAIEFLKVSAKLSKNENIALYKKAVVTINTEDSKGTGFSVSRDGRIITNYHVVKEKNSIRVIFPDGGYYGAEIVHTDPAVDLAILAIEGKNLPYLHLANETSFHDGEPIYFIGNPLRFHGIANEGTVIDYIQLSNWKDPVVMIKAPVYQGNSGSPVINKKGQVIGIIFATLTHDDFGKIGLFVPIDYYYRMG